MNHRAVAAAAMLLLGVLAMPVASADCITEGGPIGVQICEDDNGNGIPDRIRVWTPVGEAEHDEGNCGGCPFETEADAGAEGVGAGVELNCAFGGEPACTAGGMDAKARPVSVKVWFFTIGGDDDDDDHDGGDGDEDTKTWVCVRVRAPELWFEYCHHIPFT